MNRGKRGEIRNPGETMGKGNKGIFIVRKSYVYEGMSMYWWCMFLWVMEGAWEAKEERGAVMAWGRPRWSSVPVLFGGSVILKI